MVDNMKQRKRWIKENKKKVKENLLPEWKEEEDEDDGNREEIRGTGRNRRR